MSRRAGAALLAVALAALPAAGCASAVKHPAITAGIVGGTLGFGTCKLASDSYGACAAVGGAAGAFLAAVAAAAIWLGGEGNSVMAEEQAQPLPDDRPRRERQGAPPADEPAEDPAAPPSAPAPAPTAPSAAPPSPASPPQAAPLQAAPPPPAPSHPTPSLW